MFEPVDPKPKWSELQQSLIDYWKEKKLFERSVEDRPEDNPYRFYDGPPFITGMPHYGSLLSSIIKDVVPRYQTMKGKRVERVWGWDCHGLPIEQKVQAKLGLESNKEIEQNGIGTFIEECYKYTNNTSAEWGWYIDQIGRWVDFEGAYKTMDQNYMESVIHVFKRLYDKGLVYEGKRVSWYSWKLSTPISNFEIAMDDSYIESQDTAVTVKFRIQNSEFRISDVSLLAWTTTPWTIPMNMAIAVNKDLEYVIISSEEENYLVAKNRAETVFKGRKYEIIDEIKGEDLVGLSYVPPFDFYVGKIDPEKNHRVYHADFVTDESGTGIAHEAPEFGDVDFELAQKEGIHITEAMDNAGKYTSQVPDYEGQLFLDVIEPVTQRLKDEGKLFKKESITHRVPECPRSKTLLMQKAQKSWFIDIQSLKPKLFEKNEDINWFPQHVKHGRFKKSIETAPDWCISRSRYWGTPMPIWRREAGNGRQDGETVVIGGLEELYQANKLFGQMTKIIFVRHGESTGNRDAIIDTTNKLQLDNVGIQEAQNLADNPAVQEVDVIVSSHFDRARDTIKPLAQKLGMDVEISEAFGEIHVGTYDAKPAPDYWDDYYRGHMDTMEERFPEGESFQDVYDRANGKLDELIEAHPGKTILISAHDGVLRVLKKRFGQKIEFHMEHAHPYVAYVETHTKKTIDLHRPYIDDIYIPSSSARRPKNVLFVHGYTGGPQKGDASKYPHLQAHLQELGIESDVPQFDPSEDTVYSVWRDQLQTIDLSKYDTIYAHSYGCPVIMQYLLENSISVDRLVLVAPSELIGNPKLEKSIPELTADKSDLKKLAKEIVVAHSRDDSSRTAPFRYGQELAEEIGAYFVPIDGMDHGFKHGLRFLSGLVVSGAPLKRIPEVFDCWVESGSMPWAQDHYPFEGQLSGSVKKVKTPEERDEIFSFFKDMWKEEFNIEFEKKKGGIESIINDFEKSDIFYTRRDDSIASAVQLSHEKNPSKHIPGGARILGRIGTKKDYRSEGLGTQVFQRAMSHLSQEGTSEVFLNAEIGKIDLYEKWGFEKLHEEPEAMGNNQVISMKRIVSDSDAKRQLVFPADFIAEYTGQIRAWFYVMHVLAVALEDNPSFKNVIVTGVINGTDGRKMSKSYGNYPDPKKTIEQYGSDALRFYLMNSPVMRGEDMNFAEEGIQEVLKKVILPLWNAYSFFSTYANIDEWKPDGSELWFVRHAKTQCNEAGRISGAGSDTNLSEEGKKQASDLAARVDDCGMQFDTLLCSPKQRCQDTVAGIEGEIEVREDLIEQYMGAFEGMTHEEIYKKYNISGHDPLRKLYRDNDEENTKQLRDRIQKCLDDVRASNLGKKVLLCSHSGSSRAVFECLFAGVSHEELYYSKSIENATLYRLPWTAKSNELDTWILSQLQMLIRDVDVNIQKSDIQKACEPFVKFLDNLNNWYIRRNRRRFWKGEMDADKQAGYETLYEVLVTVCELLAPVCPFITDFLYQRLTDKESVHLQRYPKHGNKLIFESVNDRVSSVQKIVSLGLAYRSKNSLRVRQPLPAVWVVADLDDDQVAVVREELNVKEVKKIQNIHDYATITYAPDARKIGKSDRKQFMKEILTKAKSGDVKADGEELVIRISGQDQEQEVRLLSDEFEIRYIPKQGTEIKFEAGMGTVVGVDDTLTSELIEEGYARDIIRAIQDGRKEAGFEITDRIIYGAEGDMALVTAIESHNKLIDQEVLGSYNADMSGGDKAIMVEIDGKKIEIFLLKGT